MTKLLTTRRCNRVERPEREIDAMNAALAPLDSFALPGGTAAAAYLRPVTRRTGRLVNRLAGAEPINLAALKYLNRLADPLRARLPGRRRGARDVLWRPGARHRSGELGVAAAGSACRLSLQLKKVHDAGQLLCKCPGSAFGGSVSPIRCQIFFTLCGSAFQS